MPTSEIDEIFSRKISSHAFTPSAKSKGKAKMSLTLSDEPSLAPKKKAKKRKFNGDEEKAMTPILKSVKRSKNAAVDNEEGRDEINSSHKNPVETVVDPSFSSQTNTKLHAMPKRIAKTKIKKKEAEKDTLGRFTDSRGSGLRQRTEEGFLIFKEDELGIGDEGGDTPLCPFDCSCCF